LLGETVFAFYLCFTLNSRRPALGWPLAASQEEHLSHGIGSPLALGGWKISLIQVRLNRSASIPSCRLVGKSLPEMSIEKDSKKFIVYLFRLLFKLLLNTRRLALGWPLAVSQEEHLSYCFGSPLALGGWKISLIQVRLNRSASIPSCRLVGKSLPEMRHLTHMFLKQLPCWKMRTENHTLFDPNDMSYKT